jgi:DNA-binding CsgD family transcriptional regulator
MNSIARLHERTEGLALPTTRGGLARYLGRLARDVGADHYMLFDIARDGADETQIMASNWIYDTIRTVGVDTIRRIQNAPRTTFLGEQPRLWHPSAEAAAGSFLSKADAAALEEDGHCEFASTRIKAAGTSCCVAFSASAPRSISISALPGAHMMLSYALSALSASAPATACASPVSERERECLEWVSEGKTTDEVAMILGVSSNTVNSYVVHAMHKLSARNRPMAIAAAIRGGII